MCSSEVSSGARGPGGGTEQSRGLFPQSLKASTKTGLSSPSSGPVSPRDACPWPGGEGPGGRASSTASTPTNPLDWLVRRESYRWYPPPSHTRLRRERPGEHPLSLAGRSPFAVVCAAPWWCWPVLQSQLRGTGSLAKASPPTCLPAPCHRTLSPPPVEPGAERSKEQDAKPRVSKRTPLPCRRGPEHRELRDAESQALQVQVGPPATWTQSLM